VRPERHGRLYRPPRPGVAKGAAKLREHDAETGGADTEAGAGPAAHPPVKPNGVGWHGCGHLAHPAGDAAQGALEIALGGRGEVGGVDTAGKLRKGGDPPDRGELGDLVREDDVGAPHAQ